MPANENTRHLNHILVTGNGGPAGRSAITYLKKNGYAVIGADMQAVHSIADDFIEVPAATDPSFIQAMLKIVLEKKISLLIPTVSEELLLFAENKAAFTSLGCLVMIGSSQAVEVANDKLETVRILNQHNLATPHTLTTDTSLTKIYEVLGLPLIAKPRISRGGRGIKCYASLDELVREQRSNIIYQSFANGEEFNPNLYINHQGKVQSCIVLRKTSLREGLVGNALAVERVQRDDVAMLGQRACDAIGLTGPVDIDIRLDAKGKPLLLEINARLGANVLSASEVLDDLISDWKTMSQPMRRVL